MRIYKLCINWRRYINTRNTGNSFCWLNYQGNNCDSCIFLMLASTKHLYCEVQLTSPCKVIFSPRSLSLICTCSCAASRLQLHQLLVYRHGVCYSSIPKYELHPAQQLQPLLYTHTSYDAQYLATRHVTAACPHVTNPPPILLLLLVSRPLCSFRRMSLPSLFSIGFAVFTGHCDWLRCCRLFLLLPVLLVAAT